MSNQKNMAMTTEPMGTISSTLVFSSAPEMKHGSRVHQPGQKMRDFSFTVLGQISPDALVWLQAGSPWLVFGMLHVHASLC